MKTSKRFFSMMVATLLMATGTWAQGVITIVKQLNGVANEQAGEVEYKVGQDTGNCSLVVTPAQGNYATVENITAELVLDGGMAQAPRRRGGTPGITENLEVTADMPDNDPSGETSYTFAMTSDENYDIQVTVNFQTRTSISNAVVTLATSSFTYDGQAKTPAVQSVVLGSTTLTTADYAVSYENNVEAGTATAKVTGQRTYQGEATANFTISKAALQLSVTMDGWTYGESSPTERVPVVDGNLGQGTQTIMYKVKNAPDESYGAEQPVNAGTYTVKVTVAETDNYQSGSATADFTISKADLSLSVNLTGWTYGDAANTPTVVGNEGKGAETFTYKGANEETYSATVPTKVGSYMVKASVAETDNYNAGEATAQFAIAQADFSQVVIGDIAAQTFTGSAIQPAVTVTFKGVEVDASEYNVNYSNNTNVGTATVTLTTKNVSFAAGETNPTKTFQIVADKVTITGQNQTETYSGSAIDYTNGSVEKGVLVVTYYNSEADRQKGSNGTTEAPVNAAVYYVQLTQGDLNYVSDPVDVTFTINPKSVTNDMFYIDEDYLQVIYEEKAVTPVVYGMDGELEMSEDDFEVSYDSNNQIGTAIIYVTAKGNYQGQAVLYFEILRDMNLSFGQNTWVTYLAKENLAKPESVKAYIVTNVTGSNVTVQETEYIPQGVAVLLEQVAVSDSYIASAWQGEEGSFDDNLLQGCATATAVSSLTTANDIYVLYNNEFVKTVSGTIPANRCYLPVSKNLNAGARLAIGFEDDATGISAVNSKAIATEGQIYNLNGIRVQQPTKGLYIVNGKKVVVK